MSKVGEANKVQVHDFWNRNVCQTEFNDVENRGSREFFEEAEHIRYQYHYHILPLFDRLKNEYPGGRLLEIGCSMGTDLLQLARRGFQVTGIDLTEAGIELARSRFDMYGLDGELRVSDAETLDFPDDTFDVVYSFGVLHHTVDTEKSISEVRRVLRPGGKAVIMLYHRRSLNQLAHVVTGLPADGSRRDPVPIARTYTRAEVRRLFSPYSSNEVWVDYLFGTGWGIVNRYFPRFLHRWMGKYVGWHLMIEAVK